MPQTSLPLPRTLVIVPAYNEARCIGTVLEGLKRAAPFADVLLIDDGSTDGTAGHAPAGVAVVRLPFNCGIGAAMQTGYRYAAERGYDIAVQFDGDGQHRPTAVEPLVRHLLASESDIAVGSRFLKNVRYRQSVLRMTGSFVLGALLRLLTGRRFTDCTSGFRAVNRPVIEAFAHWYPEDYPEPEVILLLHRSGFDITETPVRMRQRRAGRSSINALQGLFYVAKVVVCLLVDMARDPWPQREQPHAQRDLLLPRPQPLPGNPGWRAAGPGDPPAPKVQA